MCVCYYSLIPMFGVISLHGVLSAGDFVTRAFYSGVLSSEGFVRKPIKSSYKSNTFTIAEIVEFSLNPNSPTSFGCKKPFSDACV